jgi:enoyl-CoA hydratase
MAALDFPAGEGAVPRGPMGPTRLQLSKPVIAAVAGPAVAGGMELALWCDLRVMEASAYMGVYCRRWGVPLIDGGTVRLPRIVGRGTALDIILTGRKVPADECFSIGLCERLVPDGESRAAAEALAHEIARFPQGCMRADRRSVFLQEGLSELDGLKSEWACSSGMVEREGAAGAVRFSSGKGRHGDFGSI